MYHFDILSASFDRVQQARAESAESALSATREQLEIAVEALKECTKQCVVSGPEHEFHHRMECLIAHSALERISAIAAKAGTGEKGEVK